MQLKEVVSAKLAKVGYDEETQMMVVQFTDSQALYAYRGVDPLTHDAMMEADSMGSYFYQNIQGKRGSPVADYAKVGDVSLLDEGLVLNDLKLESLHWWPGKNSDIAPAPKPAGKSLPPAPDIHKPAATQVELLPPTKVDTIPELPAEDEELKTRALTVQGQASAMTISNGPQYASVEAWIITIKRERKMVYDRLQRVYEPAYAAYVEARNLRDESVAPYDEAERILKDTMLAFRRKEEQERRKAEQEATEKLRQQALLDAQTQSQQQAEQEALVYESQGEIEMAQQVRANPLPVAPAAVAPAVLPAEIPAKGKSSVRENWKARNANEFALLSYAIPGITQRQVQEILRFFSVDERKLTDYAKTTKVMGNIPGAIEVYDAGSVSVRTK